MSSSTAPSRRHLMAAVALAPLAATLLSSCSGRGTALTSTVTPEKVPLPEVAGSLPTALAACDELGADLLGHRLASHPQDNALVSPLSLSLILALLADGATDAQDQGYDAVLGASGQERDRTWSAVQTSVSRNDGDLAGFDPQEIPEEPLVHLANHVAIVEGVEVEQSYLDTVLRWFSAEIEQVPRASLSGNLDAWASRHTGGLIPRSAITVTQKTILVLQSALLFAAQWEAPFQTEDTRHEPFTLAGGGTVEAELMHATHPLRHARGQGWEAVRLPYRGGQAASGDVDAPALAMDVILPAAGTLPADMEPGTWAQASAALDEAQQVGVELSLPTADLSSKIPDITDFLADRGVSLVGLEAIGPDLEVDEIIQQVRLIIDEEGTVAAALTEGEVAFVSADPLPTADVVFTVDRPYALRLRDLVSGATLLEAVIMDPTAS